MSVGLFSEHGAERPAFPAEETADQVKNTVTPQETLAGKTHEKNTAQNI